MSVLLIGNNMYARARWYTTNNWQRNTKGGDDSTSSKTNYSTVYY